MALEHVVRHPRNGVEYYNPRLFTPADEERVKEALRLYKQLLNSRRFFMDEGKITFSRPITRVAFGILSGMIVSGAAANLLGLDPNSIFWCGASPEWIKTINQVPYLPYILTAEMAGLLGIEGLSRNMIDRAKKKKFEKTWRKRAYTNDELIHVFTRRNKLDPSYYGGDLFYFDQRLVPQAVIPVAKKKVNGKIERMLMPWSRFTMTGVFNMVVGEEYEPDGRFNSEPKLIKIPPTGLFVGLAVLGPTGSGKSQSVLLPFLYQGAGYYSWIDSERDEWLFNAAQNISKCKRLASRAKSKIEAAKYLDMAAELQKKHQEWLEAFEAGDDPSTGYQKMGIFLVEPKAEMWRDLRNVLKFFGREKDYIELGIVRSKYESFAQYSQRLENMTKGLWGYSVESYLVNKTGMTLREFGREFAIQIPAESTNEDLVDAVFGNGEMAARGEGRSLRETWTRNFYTSITRRNHNQRIRQLESPDWGSKDPLVGRYARALTMTSDSVFSPWCFAGSWIDQDEPFVGPFGFGSRNDPWALRYYRDNPNYENAQGYFISTVESINRVLGALSLRFEGFHGSGVMRLAEQKPLITKDEESDQGRDRVVQELRKDSQGLPRLFDGSESEFRLGHVLVPAVSPGAVLRAPVQEQEAGGRPQMGDPRAKLKDVANRVKEGLTLAPLSRTEFSHLRKKIRAVAPFNQIPDEWRSEFRVRVKMWHAKRRQNEFFFMKELVDGLDPSGVESYASFRHRMDAVLRQSELGNDLSGLITRVFSQNFTLAMVQGVLRYLLNAPEEVANLDDLRVGSLLAMDVVGPRQKDVFKALESAGWDYFERAPITESGYDGVAECALRPSKSLVELLCNRESIKVEDGFFEDLSGFLQFREVLEREKGRVLLSYLLSMDADRVPMQASLRSMVKAIRQDVAGTLFDFWSKSGKLGSSRSVFAKLSRFLPEGHEAFEKMQSMSLQADRETGFTVEDAGVIWSGLWDQARDAGFTYLVDPKIPTGDGVSDDPEDFESVVDTSKQEVALGPWDSLWSEVIGQRVWEPLRDVARRVLAKAMVHCGAKEVDVLRSVAIGDEASAQETRRVLGVVERQLEARRREVLDETLNYLSQVEDFLKTLSPYYKTNVPFTYGFKDSGKDDEGRPIGIGDCCGVNKYNPVHIPYMSPDQLSSALIAALTKNAGEGDTDVFKNAAKKMATNFVSILRVAKGYITVSDILQMVSSDPFVTLMMDRAERRIQSMEGQQGSVGDVEALRKATVLERWRLFNGLDNVRDSERGDIESGFDLSEMPAEMRWVLPRMASEAELSAARQLLDKGRAFVINEWRNPKGEFASDEMRGNAKQTFSQMDPLLTGIGSYCFCPDDPEEISFPAWDEIRTKGLAVATRFNMTTDPSLGGLVIGMAITSYQTTVMQAKENQTDQKDLFASVMGGLDRKREELSMLRAEVRELERTVVGRPARASEVQKVVLGLLRGADRNSDPIECAREIVDKVYQANRDGVFDGKLVLDHTDCFVVGGTGEAGRSRGRMAALAGGGQDFERRVMSEAQVFFRAAVAQAGERDSIVRDKLQRLKRRVWTIRQEILNGTARLEMYPDFSRYMLFVIDEYQMFKNFAKKGGGLSDEVFLSASRAGRSFNVFCTQTPSSVKSGVSADAFTQWLANILNRIVLGAPTKEDAELISDVFGSREMQVEEPGGFSVNVEGVDIGAGGQVRASKVAGGSKSYSLKKEEVKYVKPSDLLRMRAMSSWVQLTDGQVKMEPKLVYHVPYFLLTSDKVSSVTDEPLCQKTWVGLVRDGELDLVPPEDDNMRRLMEYLQMTGVDMKDELDDLDARSVEVGEG
jgi:hypothetical protein